MEPTHILTTVFAIFAAAPNLWTGLPQATADLEVPDLCTEVVYLDLEGAALEDADGTKLSVYCEWTGEDAPVWADEVCCELGPDSAYCTPTGTDGECSPFQAKRWCEFGEFDGEQVNCLQPFPSACNSIECVAPPVGTPQEGPTPLCCYAGICYELSFDERCGGSYNMCDSPYTNEDGTVGCADED